MIKKEEIQQRRQEIAEIRHADSVYRDIIARNNEREDYEKRWFWELLQNAKDSVDSDQKIKVKIEISENEISFSHTGNSFELDDILSLIIQGSSKNDKQGKTGRFGTGFMTTYLLSKEVRISGMLTEDQGCFEFLLNRKASNNEEFYRTQKQSNEDFENSIRENSYLGNTEFQTKFSYALDEKGKHTARTGLHSLDELIPITQLFNEQIESVTVIENENVKTFTRSYTGKFQTDEGEIDGWEINTVINDSNEKTIKAYIFHDDTYDACIITHSVNENETIFPLTQSYPRLYFTFPLIGTEEIGIPVIINSTNFEPRVERDGIYLKKINEETNESQNKEIIQKALENSSRLFAKLLSKNGVKGIFELFNYSLSKDLKWVDHYWFNQIKNNVITQLSDQLVINSNAEDSLTSLNNLTIPYSNSPENTKKLWELLSHIKDLKIPLIDELNKWIEIAEKVAKLEIEAEDIYALDFVWGIKDLIKFIENREGFEGLESVLFTNVGDWLNKFYQLIVQILTFPLDRRILLNQDNKLRRGEGVLWDKCKDDELTLISKQTKLNFRNKLISRLIVPFHIPGIDEFSRQDAVNELKNYLNSLSETDFDQIELLQCNASFLKWLISKNEKETIRDLKVLSGGNNKNDETYIFDHFPKNEHLLLTPKRFFENDFPLYASLVRDKDCLNAIYNEYLTADDYKYLEENGFINYTPLVIREELISFRNLEYLIVNEDDLSHLKDEEGQIKHKIKITYTDYAYLTAADGHIYDRNKTQRSSLERFKFLLQEAVEKDKFFEDDIQEVTIEGISKPLHFHKCLWIYRAKKLNWINIKTESENSEPKFISETPSSKNLSELIKREDHLIKAIKGSKQQLLLNKLGIGVSDLIRNTLPNDELRLSWDKAITNMITSDADPELVQEIFNDASIKKEYEKRLLQRKIINRNQTIGKLVEDLFKEYINQLKETEFSIKIERKPFGSDYIITEDSSDLVNINNQREGFKINDWLIELKTTGRNYAAMTPLQAQTASENKNNYALIVIPLDGSEPDINYIRTNAKVIQQIGYKIDDIISDYNDVELIKADLITGKDGISVAIEDQNVRFKVSSEIWLSEQVDIKHFMETNFSRE